MNGRELPQMRVPKQQFIRIIEAASGVAVVWDTDDAPQIGDEAGSEWAWIQLGMQGPIDIGWDEQRTQLNESTVPPTQDTITIGRRECTLNVMAYSEDPELEAFDLCERIRMGFNTDRVRSFMIPTISLRWCERVVRLPKTKINGRLQLRANLDVQMSYAVGADSGNSGTKNYVLDAGVASGTLKP